MTKKRSKTIFRILLLVGTAISLFYVPWIFIKIWITPLPDTVQDQVNEAIKLGMDGVLVYVDQAGSNPQFYSAGWKDRDQKIPADPKHLFKIASISKLYIAVAVAKLVHADSLSLDKTLVEYWPEIGKRIEHSDKITLRMLVQHRSGIPNYTDHPDYPWASPYKTSNETFELVYDQPADFIPDRKYAYSNTNYLLIGKILDQTLGYSHHQYIKSAILEPLNLNHTYSLLSEVNLDDVMSGYFVGYEFDIKSNDFVQPGGSMVATIDDVGVFLRALNDGTLLTEDEQAIYSSIYEYEHTGLLPGYQSIARYHKDLDAVIILFVNTSGGKMWTIGEMVYNRIVRIVSGD